MKFLGTKLFIALSFVLFFPKNLISNPLTYNQQVLKTLQKSPHFFPDSHAIGNLKPVDISTKNGKTLLILASGLKQIDGALVEQAMEEMVALFRGNKFDIFIPGFGELGQLNSLDAKFYDPIWQKNLSPFLFQSLDLDAPQKGALSGKRIFISPGHGYYYNPDRDKWYTQRTDIYGLGLVEDFHTNEISFNHLMKRLKSAGAEVISARESSYIQQEIIIHSDSENFKIDPDFQLSKLKGFKSKDYFSCKTLKDRKATATWKFQIPESGYYPVYVAFRAGENRIKKARFKVFSGEGIKSYFVNQKQGNLRWILLSKLYFPKNFDGKVELSCQSEEEGHVIADSIRIGGKLKSLSRGMKPFPHEGWKASARYFAEYIGAPELVLAPSWSERTRDITVRPFMAEWWGADAYVSLHTNAVGSSTHKAGKRGYGTSSYVHSTRPSKGSESLRVAIHDQLIKNIRKNYLSNWTDRGKHSANFGELRELKTIPGVLLELAFHDTEKPDVLAIHSPNWRSLVSRSIVKGLIDYLKPNQQNYPPLAPSLKSLRFSNKQKDICGEYSLSLDRLHPQKAAAKDIEVFLSTIPRNPGTLYKTLKLPEDDKTFCVTEFDSNKTYFIRLRAKNSAGNSLFSAPLTFRKNILNSEKKLALGIGFFRKDQKTGERFSRNHFWQEVVKNIQVTFVSSFLPYFKNYSLSPNDYAAHIILSGIDNDLSKVFNENYLKNYSKFLTQGGFSLWSGSNIGYSLRSKPELLKSFFAVKFNSDDHKEFSYNSQSGKFFNKDLEFQLWQKNDDHLSFPFDQDSYESNSICLFSTKNSSPCAFTKNSLILGFPLSSLKNNQHQHFIQSFLQSAGFEFSSDLGLKPSIPGLIGAKEVPKSYEGESGCGCTLDKPQPPALPAILLIFLLIISLRYRRLSS